MLSFGKTVFKYTAGVVWWQLTPDCGWRNQWNSTISVNCFENIWIQNKLLFLCSWWTVRRDIDKLSSSSWSFIIIRVKLTKTPYMIDDVFVSLLDHFVLTSNQFNICILFTDILKKCWLQNVPLLRKSCL